MKQKEQIKIARDLILNGLSERAVLHPLPVIILILTFTVNVLREANVPEDKIPKSTRATTPRSSSNAVSS